MSITNRYYLYNKELKEIEADLDSHLGLHLALKSFSHGLQKGHIYIYISLKASQRSKPKDSKKKRNLVKLNKDLDSSGLSVPL